MSNKSPEKQGQQPQKTLKGGVSCNVFLLDGESLQIALDKNDTGKELFQKVCEHLDLIEKDYFGLTYTDDRGPSHLKYWLNLDKKISKQKKRGAWVFDFALKFYPPDPSSLRESLTRWLVVLQVRRDLLSGRLPCTFTTYALLGSYNVQADVGEHDGNEQGASYDYIKDMTFAPNQTPELLEKIAELHKQHRGQTPDEAERCFLDNAKKLSMYGVDLHKAKDSDNNAIMLGVCASGLLIYRDKLRINRFVWPKILKLSYKRNHFYIKIRPAEIERNETTIMFKLDNHRLAKRLWKTCVEHHAFFRLRESDRPTHNPTFPRFGSKFRYSGRTLFQTRQTAALLDRPPPFFERTQPNRDSYADGANRSRSVDELAGRYNKDPYSDSSSYDPNSSFYSDPNRLADGRDRRDNMKGGPPGYGTIGRDGEYRSDAEGGTLERRPYDSNTEDRRDRLNSQDATLERDGRQGHGDDSMNVPEGGMTLPGQQESDKDRRKREKEEDKRRKKEAEENKKREEEEKKRAEEERKRAEKEKKKKGGKGDLDVSEDRQDRLGQGQAVETSFGADPGSAGLDNGPSQYLNPDGTYKEGYGPNGPLDGHGGEEGPDGKHYVTSYHVPGLNRGRDQGEDMDKDGTDKDGKDKDGKDKDKDGKDKDKKDKKKSGGSFFGRKKKDKHTPQDEDRAGGLVPGQEDALALAQAQDDALAHAQAGGNALADYPQGNLVGLGPYGVGLGVGKGDLTGIVGDEGSVDNKQIFLPLHEPEKGTKSSLKSEAMPFFHPAATSTVGRSKIPPPVAPKGSNNSMDDSFNRNDPPTVATERVKYSPNPDQVPVTSRNIPVVKTQTRTVTYEREGCPSDLEDGLLITASSHSSRLQTVETTTYKKEIGGTEEIRVEQRVVVSGDDDDDDFDFDAALSDAIRSVTEFNPDMSVERIECVQQIEDVKDGQ